MRKKLVFRVEDEDGLPDFDDQEITMELKDLSQETIREVTTAAGAIVGLFVRLKLAGVRPMPTIDEVVTRFARFQRQN